MEESLNMEHWWSDTDIKLQYFKKNLSQCHFDHHKSHIEWPGTKPGPPQWQAGN